VKPSKLDGSASWAFHRQFEAVADHITWTSSENTVHLLAVLQGQAAEVPDSVPGGAICKDIVGAMKGCYRDHQLWPTRCNRKPEPSLLASHEFAAAIEQLAHWALVGLPVKCVQREATHAFIDKVRDWEVKQHLLMGGKRSLNEALN
jgi:hypothetical protein